MPNAEHCGCGDANSKHNIYINIACYQQIFLKSPYISIMKIGLVLIFKIMLLSFISAAAKGCAYIASTTRARIATRHQRNFSLHYAPKQEVKRRFVSMKLRKNSNMIHNRLRELSTSMDEGASSQLGKSGPRKSVLEKVISLGRGGSSFVAGQEMLTFGQNLSVQVFSFLLVLNGLSCCIAPRKMLRWYGLNELDTRAEDDEEEELPTDATMILMQAIAAITTGIGLTAAFAVACEMRALGHMPQQIGFHKAMGYGLVPSVIIAPRIILDMWKANTNKLRFNMFQVIANYVLAIISLQSLCQGINPVLTVNSMVLESILLGPFLLFIPQKLFRSSHTADVLPEERFLTRLLGMFITMSGVLTATLQSHQLNALPSVGLTALTWAIGLLYIIFVSEDAPARTVQNYNRFVLVHLGMISAGFAVATSGLRHYLIM